MAEGGEVREGGGRRTRGLRNREWEALKGGSRKDGEIESLKGGWGQGERGFCLRMSLSFCLRRVGIQLPVT